MKLLTPNSRAMLRNRRLKQGIAQQALANELGITNVRLCQLEKGLNHPSLALLDRWCTALGLSLSVDIRPRGRKDR